MPQLQFKKKKREVITLKERMEELTYTQTEIQKRLIFFFKYHIGLENSVNPSKIFEAVYGMPPTKLDVFKRLFLWTAIKKLMKMMRHEKILFITNRGRRWYVLQSESELAYYKKRNKLHRDNLLAMDQIATDWVEKRRWNKL